MIGRDAGWGGDHARSRINRLLLYREGGRNDWASLSGTVQILKGDRGSGQSTRLIGLRIAGREGHGNCRVFQSLSCLNVRDKLLTREFVSGWVQAQNIPTRTYRNILVLGRWTRTRDLDGLSIRAIDRTVTIARSSRVDSRLESQWRRKLSDGSGVWDCRLSLDF